MLYDGGSITLPINKRGVVSYITNSAIKIFLLLQALGSKAGYLALSNQSYSLLSVAVAYAEHIDSGHLNASYSSVLVTRIVIAINAYYLSTSRRAGYLSASSVK